MEEESGKKPTVAPPVEFQDGTGTVAPSLFLNSALEKMASKAAARVVHDAAAEAAAADAWSFRCSQECHPSWKSSNSSSSCALNGPMRLCWTPEPLQQTAKLCAQQSEDDAQMASAFAAVRCGCEATKSVKTLPTFRGRGAACRRNSEHCSLDCSDKGMMRCSDEESDPDEPELLAATYGSEIVSDMYNVPFDSDIYAVPVDVVVKSPESANSTPNGSKTCRHLHHHHQLARPTPIRPLVPPLPPPRNGISGDSTVDSSVPEPIHMTLQEVRQYLQTLYCETPEMPTTSTGKSSSLSVPPPPPPPPPSRRRWRCMCKEGSGGIKQQRRRSLSSSLKNTLCNWFHRPHHRIVTSGMVNNSHNQPCMQNASAGKRTLPPLPPLPRRDSPTDMAVHTSASTPSSSPRTLTPTLPLACSPSPVSSASPTPSSTPVPDTPLPMSTFDMEDAELNSAIVVDDDVQEASPTRDFASSIQKVKDYGWYWGPISGEAAERILGGEPDGSFVVRDSSDHHYIFSLTFKLNGFVRHVRIEHDQGNFSFGSCTRFKSHTIVDFIEKAVEHSRSGRFLFFLHRRPVLGPMRVQLLHPVSRFKQVQSLQHMCRFVILKHVRRDLISALPLPKRLVAYLSTPHYYSENFEEGDHANDTEREQTEQKDS